MFIQWGILSPSLPPKTKRADRTTRPEITTAIYSVPPIQVHYGNSVPDTIALPGILAFSFYNYLH
jgi:hypothetical protein